jgi:hypothetical protein
MTPARGAAPSPAGEGPRGVEGVQEDHLEEAGEPGDPAPEPGASDSATRSGRDRTRVSAIRYALGIGDSNRPFMRPRGAEG